MGQKVNPHGMRLGIIKHWDSIWFANKKDFANNLKSDFEVRKFILKKLSKASVSKVVIERPAKSIRITIFTSRPGIVIGRKGEDIEKIRLQIVNMIQAPVQINISEIKKPEIDSKLVANNISLQLERRVMFRRVMKRSVQNAMRNGAKGIKIEISGRLGGAEIARREWYREGRVPLHTLRANIEYSVSKAHTTYGIIGVKVWIFKGEILGNIDVMLKLEKLVNKVKKQYRKRTVK
ncbi:30S ribosomal protein S3 [Buchnera aphidicola (Ceratoglyphina bambusae)]|uniref:30S ribosomal protein S3 n=1 Tax=Buchnera aphidicola TaxID=9 RepID=UPI0031B80FE5